MTPFKEEVESAMRDAIALSNKINIIRGRFCQTGTDREKKLEVTAIKTEQVALMLSDIAGRMK